MAKKTRKMAAKKVARARSNARLGRQIAMSGSPWSIKEQALSWALQIPRGSSDARQVIADAKHFEEYLSGGAVRK